MRSIEKIIACKEPVNAAVPRLFAVQSRFWQPPSAFDASGEAQIQEGFIFSLAGA